jgi:DNA-binding LytR/AlgR family response regulator
VVDYLVKPVPFNRFVKACNKALEMHENKNITRIRDKPGDATFFFINADYKYIKVIFADILWVEGLKDYIRIYLKSSNKPLLARLSMKSIEEQLPSSIFIRIQRSFIVSKLHITALRKNSVFIDRVELPVGEQYKNAVLQLLGKHPE